jgi:hypothetical protein
MLCAFRSKAFIDYFESGGTRNARLIYEEYANYKTVGETEIRGLNTLRKKGVRFTFISQSLPDDERVLEAIQQNCGIRIAHRCGSWKTAEVASKWFSGNIDPYKVHHTTERQVHDGYDEQVTRSSSTQISDQTDDPHNIKRVEDAHGMRRTGRTSGESTQFISRYKTVVDEHFHALCDQDFLQTSYIQNGLGVGWRLVNDNGHIVKEYVPLPKSRWPWPGVMEEKIRRSRESMKQLPFCITPNLSEPVITCVPTTLSGNTKSSNGSGRIHQHTTSSRRSGNTANTNQPRGRRSNGKNGDSSTT